MRNNKVGILAVAVLLSLAACSSSSATAPVPTSPPATASADATATPSAVPVASAAPTATPAPATAAATALQSAAPTADATATPAAMPVDYSAASGADPCTASDVNKAYLLDTAKKVKFDLYCAVLPKGWVLKTSSYSIGAKGAYFEAIYQVKAKTVKIMEGTVCSIGSGCTVDSPIAGAYFGTMPASLYSSGDMLVVGAKFGSNPAWAMQTSGGVTQDETLAFAAALYKVPAA